MSRDVWLDKPYQGETESGVHIFRFGVTNDLRTLWFDNRNSIYTDDKALKEAIKEAGLSYSSVLVTQTKQVKRSRKHKLLSVSLKTFGSLVWSYYMLSLHCVHVSLPHFMNHTIMYVILSQ